MKFVRIDKLLNNLKKGYIKQLIILNSSEEKI
jgi:hypothetical protein